MKNTTNIKVNIKINILHSALEFKKGVGGIKAVTMGLIPALASKEHINVSIVTPFYDVYNNFYADIQQIATVKHIYKGKILDSLIFRACTEVVNNKPVYHYLIKPRNNSPAALIFSIKDEKNIYQSFSHSWAGNRVEYFNGAVASMVRTPNVNVPIFDILHTHAWHTGLAGCLIKEFENIENYQKLIQSNDKVLRKIPYIVSTVHMLLEKEHGQLTTEKIILEFLDSLGLPLNLEQKFTDWPEYINRNHIKRIVLSLLYSDMVMTVSKGLANEMVTGKGQGLDKIFKYLNQHNRLIGITNGINHKDWDATREENLGEFAFSDTNSNVSSSKQRLKEYLVGKYPKLDSKKMWFMFIGRFAQEKGMDMMIHALNAISQVNANFIIMGMHVAKVEKNGVIVNRYQEDLDLIRGYDNVVVIEDSKEQNEVGKMFRGAVDSMLVLSHNEACGLIPMEGMACAAITVASNIQGLPDSIKPITGEPNIGNGFLYSDAPDSRCENLKSAIVSAANYYAGLRKDGSLDPLLASLLVTSKKFDWKTQPLTEYNSLYSELLTRGLLTFDQIRSRSAPIINQFLHQNKPIHIFQIGFNKCGTQALHDFFCANGVRSVHYHYGKLAESIFDNKAKNLPLLSERYEQYTGFFDMENIYADTPLYAHRLFKEFDRQYPFSKFILNVRNKESWINSRSSHTDMANGKSYIDIISSKYNLPHDEVKEIWRKEWDDHHQAVIEYFKDRPKDLLVFNIELDQPQKICEFFKDIFKMNPAHFKHLNKTTVSEEQSLKKSSVQLFLT